MHVITPKEFEQTCLQTVAIGTVISLMAIVPVHMIGMYTTFTKLDKMFNPHRLLANQRRRKFAKRIAKK
jgi:hypothetical protein